MTEKDQKESYLTSIQEQILEILNRVKEEVGVDMPVEIIVTESEK